MSYVIALDQGTTSSRSILYDLEGKELAVSSYEYPLAYPEDAWVELDPEDIWKTQKQSLQDVLSDIDPKNVKALGITNQRETIIAWDPKTGKSLAPAIVWQCRRTANYCEELKQQGLEDLIKLKTGLTLDPYFSASKIRWLIDNNQIVKKHYEKDQVVFGTVDSWLIYQLTSNCLTDTSNASRTMLFNIANNQWDQELLEIFDVKESALCEVKASNANFGDVSLFGLNAPICGVLGDQQSSLFGHSAMNPNDSKCTFGTGAFLMYNTGNQIKYSDSGLLSTIAWTIEKDDQIETTYALEGSVFIAGSLMKWLRDKLEIVESAKELDLLALKVNDNAGLVIVPAFVGLGSPYWDVNARGAIFGITAEANKAHLAYASLEGIAHQVADLIDLEELKSLNALLVDGGMIKSKIFLEILAGIIQKEIIPAEKAETTAYGAFKIAGYGAGLIDPFEDIQSNQEKIAVQLSKQDHSEKRNLWSKAIERSKNWI